MTKNEFLSDLDAALVKLSKSDRKRTLDYYREQIDDRVENGMDEQAAVMELESVSEITASLMSEIAPTVEKPRNGLLAALAVIGSPIWLSLTIALAAVMFSLTAAVLAVAVSLFAIEFALGASGLACVVCAIPLMASNPLSGVFALGAGLILLGLSILLFKPLKSAAASTYRFSINTFTKTLNKLFRKECAII